MSSAAHALDARPEHAVGHHLEPGRCARILGRASLTNARLAAAFRARGYQAAVARPHAPFAPRPGDVTLARLDVLPGLDGVEAGLRRLEELGRSGDVILNRPGALLRAHDKLATAIVLARAAVRHPRTAHVQSAEPPPALRPPYVVKPRFGSWGRDVFRCESSAELATCFDRLSGRRWFRPRGERRGRLHRGIRAGGEDPFAAAVNSLVEPRLRAVATACA